MTRRVEHVAGGVMYDGVQTGETLQCCHCGGHWIRKVGSGTLRGYCAKCNSVTCGADQCMVECKPFEKWLEEVEAKARVAEPLMREQHEQAVEGIIIAKR